MREPSRHLPPLPPPSQRQRIASWGCLSILAAGLGAVAWYHPVQTGCVLLAPLLVGWLARFADTPARRLDRLIQSRPAKDALCRFARDFDYRRTDTWLIRAVFEEVQGRLAMGSQPVPVRANDRLDNLGLDADDRDDIGVHSALRAGYSMDGNRRNPFYDKVETVGDIVRFLQLQPCARHLAAMPEDAR